MANQELLFSSLLMAKLLRLFFITILLFEYIHAFYLAQAMKSEGTTVVYSGGAISDVQKNFESKIRIAQLLRGGTNFEVTSVEQAKIAASVGAFCVIVSDPVDGGISRMPDPKLIKEIKEFVSVRLMAKVRVGHFVEGQILQEVAGVEFIDENETIVEAAMADLRWYMVVFGYAKKREAMKLVDLENAHSVFDKFTQRTSKCIYSITASSISTLDILPDAISSGSACNSMVPRCVSSQMQKEAESYLVEELGFTYVVLIDKIENTDSGVHFYDTNSTTRVVQSAKPLVDFPGINKEKVIVSVYDPGGVCISNVVELFLLKVSKAISIAAAMLNLNAKTSTGTLSIVTIVLSQKQLIGYKDDEDGARLIAKFIIASGYAKKKEVVELIDFSNAHVVFDELFLRTSNYISSYTTVLLSHQHKQRRHCALPLLCSIYLGVDVGTGTARADLFDEYGKLLGSLVKVSWSGDTRKNVIVWMDHSAVKQLERINASSNSHALQYCGGSLSQEMQPPKLSIGGRKFSRILVNGIYMDGLE